MRNRSYRQLHMVMMTIFIFVMLLAVIPATIAQQDNICRSNDLQQIQFGETLTGTVDPTFPILLCFEAERGSTITVTVQPLAQGLTPGMDVGTPFVDSNDTLIDPPIISEVATAPGSGIQGTATIEADGTYLINIVPVNGTTGSVSITLELSGGNVLGANPDTSEENTPSGNEEAAGGTANIVYGETDLCTTSFSTEIAYGDTLEGETNEVQPVFYCFEASEGDIVTIDFTAGELPVAYLLVDPFYDLQESTPRYTEVLAQNPGETVSRELAIPRDGQYVIFAIGLVQGNSATFTLSIDGFAGNVYTCQNYPIETLVSTTWGITDTDGTTVIELTAACSQRLSFDALGGSSIVPFNVTQDDEVFFVYRGRSFTTVELSDEAWVIERDDSEIFTLQPVDGAATLCEQDNVAALVQGSWYLELDPTQPLFLDFTCTGTVFVDDTQTEPIIGTYTIEDDLLTLTIGTQIVEFRDIVVAEDVLTTNLVLDGIDPIPFELPNALYDAPDEEPAEEE